MGNNTFGIKMIRFFGYFAFSLAIFLFASYIFESAAMKNRIHLQDLKTEQIHTGLGVEGEVPFTLGSYASKNSTVNGMTVSSDSYYIVPYGSDYSCYMGMYGTYVLSEQFEDLYNATIDCFQNGTDISDKAVPFTGIVFPSIFKMKKYFIDAMEQVGISDYATYYILPVDSGYLERSLAVAIVCGILGIIISVFANLEENKMIQRGIPGQISKQTLRSKCIMFLIVLLLSIGLMVYVIF